MTPFHRSRLIQALLTGLALATGMALLCWPAIRNGFPFVFSDTGAYIAQYEPNLVSIFTPHLDRPDYYSYLIWFFSAGRNLWGIIIAQALIMAWLLYRAACAISSTKTALVYLIFCIATAIASVAPVLASTIVPDIWLTYAFIAAILYVAFENSFANKSILLGLIFASSLVSASHATIVVGSLIALTITRIFFKFPLTRSLVCMIPPILAVLLLCMGNYKVFGSFKPVEGSQMFIFARLADNRNLDKVLPRYCIDHEASLVCQHQHDILSAPSESFIIWSPLGQAINGLRDNSRDLARINRMALHAEPLGIIKASLIHSMQLFSMQSPNFLRDVYRGPYPVDTAPYVQIAENYSHQVRPYLAALQQSDSEESFLTMIWLKLAWAAVILGLVYLASLPIRRLFGAAIPLSLVQVGVFCIAASLVNAIVSASLSAVVLRYELRSSAMITALACMCLIAMRNRGAAGKPADNGITSIPEVKAISSR
jgi:hypothetical protein